MVFLNFKILFSCLQWVDNFVYYKKNYYMIQEGVYFFGLEKCMFLVLYSFGKGIYIDVMISIMLENLVVKNDN